MLMCLLDRGVWSSRKRKQTQLGLGVWCLLMESCLATSERRILVANREIQDISLCAFPECSRELTCSLVLGQLVLERVSKVALSPLMECVSLAERRKGCAMLGFFLPANIVYAVLCCLYLYEKKKRVLNIIGAPKPLW